MGLIAALRRRGAFGFSPYLHGVTSIPAGGATVAPVEQCRAEAARRHLDALAAQCVALGVLAGERDGGPDRDVDRAQHDQRDGGGARGG